MTSSSLAPLLAGEYAKVTLIDLRYISADALFKLVEFSENADALFLYGSLILNDSALLLAGVSDGGTHKLSLATGELQPVSDKLYLGSVTAP